MRRLWHRFVFWLLGGDRMLREWRRDFPDRCPICAYHRYGIREFHVAPGEPVPPHDCIERKLSLLQRRLAVPKSPGLVLRLEAFRALADPSWLGWHRQLPRRVRQNGDGVLADRRRKGSDAMRTTHTYAILEISAAAYEEIRAKLEQAGYQHAFHPKADGRIAIDMYGIAVATDMSDVLDPPDADGDGGWEAATRDYP